MSLLSAMALTSPLALNLFVPAMPDAARDLGVDINIIQLTFTSYLLTLAIGQLISGPLADFFGRKPVLLWGLALHVLGSLLATLANDISFLVAGRVLQALGGSTAMSLARTIIVDVHGRQGAAGKMGFMVMSIAIAQSIAPTLGGFLNLWYGWNSTLVLPMLIGSVVWFATLKWLPETCSEKSDSLKLGRVLTQYRSVLTSSEYLGYALSTTFIATAFYMFVGSSPYIVVNQLGGNSAQFGSWFLTVSLAFMLGSFLSTHMAKWLNIDRMVMLGNALSLLGAAALLLFALENQLSLATLFLPMALVTFGRGFSQPNAQSGAIACATGSAGTASGLMGFIQLLTGAVMAQITPWLIAQGLVVLMSAILAAPLLAMACHSYAWRRRANPKISTN
ncbi:Bcr/CflA family drug resistance efflux transporter [Oceanospirillum multiglobuliferum]|uniref:Bcr/CflA family efflux transporter n=2 Tax=Oceanospirillum multiglobuliferum TaxID=64969 RepID=A0A1V4T8B5_9GAMM|nr:Bcr/CflA family drug resistance efflux transporter [Oceanospirillum multiglobuliferum]